VIDVLDDVADTGLTVVDMGEAADDIAEVASVGEPKGRGIVADLAVDVSEVVATPLMPTLVRGRLPVETHDADGKDNACCQSLHFQPPGATSAPCAPTAHSTVRTSPVSLVSLACQRMLP
jgi:hypothetical protein